MLRIWMATAWGFINLLFYSIGWCRPMSAVGGEFRCCVARWFEFDFEIIKSVAGFSQNFWFDQMNSLYNSIGWYHATETRCSVARSFQLDFEMIKCESNSLEIQCVNKSRINQIGNFHWNLAREELLRCQIGSKSISKLNSTDSIN